MNVTEYIPFTQFGVSGEQRAGIEGKRKVTDGGELVWLRWCIDRTTISTYSTTMTQHSTLESNIYFSGWINFHQAIF